MPMSQSKPAGAEIFIPVTFARDWNHTARFHEWYRAQPTGRSDEPGGQSDADAHSNRGVADAQTRRLGVSTSSLARVSDGSEPARCIHGVGMRVWIAVWIRTVY